MPNNWRYVYTSLDALTMESVEYGWIQSAQTRAPSGKRSLTILWSCPRTSHGSYHTACNGTSRRLCHVALLARSVRLGDHVKHRVKALQLIPTTPSLAGCRSQLQSFHAVFYVVSQPDATGEQGDVAQTSAGTVAGMQCGNSRGSFEGSFTK